MYLLNSLKTFDGKNGVFFCMHSAVNNFVVHYNSNKDKMGEVVGAVWDIYQGILKTTSVHCLTSFSNSKSV